MKYTIITLLILFILSISAFYFLNTNPSTPCNSSEPSPAPEIDTPINEISDKGKTEKPENNNLATSVKEHKHSPVSETNLDIPDLTGKPEPLRTLLDPQKDDTKRNEVANSLRESGYKNLTDDLITVLDNPNEKARFRSFAVQHLYNNYAGAGESEKQKIRGVFYKSLNDRHVEVRREALLSLVRIKDPKGKETAAAWLKDPNTDNVRDLAIRCVKLLDLKEHIPAIRKYLYDKNNVIRIAAIAALSQWQDKQSKPAFKKAAESQSVRLKRAGKAALKRLEERNR